MASVGLIDECCLRYYMKTASTIYVILAHVVRSHSSSCRICTRNKKISGCARFEYSRDVVKTTVTMNLLDYFSGLDRVLDWMPHYQSSVQILISR